MATMREMLARQRAMKTATAFIPRPSSHSLQKPTAAKANQEKRAIGACRWYQRALPPSGRRLRSPRALRRWLERLCKPRSDAVHAPLVVNHHAPDQAIGVPRYDATVIRGGAQWADAAAVVSP